MCINFANLKFEFIDDRILLTDFMGFATCKNKDKMPIFNFVEVQIAGENHAYHSGAKLARGSEWNKLKYVSHKMDENLLVITQKSDLVKVDSYFQRFNDCNALRMWNVVTNISNRKITIEHISSALFKGIGKNNVESIDNLYIYKFPSSWHVECQPKRFSFFDLSLQSGNNIRSMKRISGCNTGSWSTKEELPQAIIEDGDLNKFLMFQIESNNSWYYEIAEEESIYYVNLGGPNTTFNSWSKALKPSESFETVKVAVSLGNSLNSVIGEITKYRRHIVKHCIPDENLPTIFNEYMHLSWDNPNEHRTKSLINWVKDLGIDYYVIDCGWHDECDYDIIYKKVGKWQPSKRRFPSGIEKTIEEIHKVGLKAGLWIEPEIIGVECSEMEEFYGDDAFFYRNGEKIRQSNRMFLDFRNEKVRSHMTEVIDRMVAYGVDYIKFDYNQDTGAGTELNSCSLGDGLFEHAKAYFNWVESLMEKYPSVIIEACSSGGQRMDYKTLSLHPLVSTSDQTNYKKYPYIAGNILSAVLPEQAAVWSYPVESVNSRVFDEDTFETVNKRISVEQVIFNMVNSFLGRMHLASNVSLLSEEKKNYIKEGIKYYNSISSVKKKALPYFPLGFTDFHAKSVCSGFIFENKIYLALWNLNGKSEINIPIKEYKVKNVKIAYPSRATEKVDFDEHNIKVNMESCYKARFLEIEIK